jgi:hypothetical protein
MANTPFQLDMSPVTEDLNLTPGLSKIETLAQSKEAKISNLGQTTRNKFYDADTFYQGSQGVRLGDPSGAFAQAPEAPGTIEKRYGRPATPQEVAEYETSMKVLDNYFAGVVPAPQEAVQGLLDQPLTQEEQTLYNEAIRQTPMGTAETTGIEGHTGKFGRQIAQVQVPEQEDTLQERLIGSGIAPEKMGTSAFERIPSTGYKSYSDLQGTSAADADGMIGESVDIAQSSLIQEWGKIGKVAAKAGRWIGESLGVDKKTMEAIMPDKSGLFDESFTNLAKQEVADKMTGVMAKTREEQQAGMEAALKNVEDGNYGKAAWDTVKILPYMLGDSAGEMAAIMAGTPGITLAVAARVNEDAEEYEKNNGIKPDTQWVLGSTLLNAGALFGEKFLIKSGIGSIVEKGVSKAARTGGIAASAVGEATQEYYDQVQQTFMTQKEGEQTLGEIATSPEAQLGALAGGVMGGALRGAGEAVGAATDQAKPVVGKAAGRIADEIDRRKAAKAEQEAKIAEAEKEGEPAPLTATYGGEEGVRAKEAEYQTSIDEAAEKGDIGSVMAALTAYRDDIQNDTEEILDKNEYTARVNKAKAMVAAHEEKIVQGEASQQEAQTFGSSSELIGSFMEGKTFEEAEKFYTSFKDKYKDAPVELIEQHLEAKKSLADVGEEVSKDIVAKAKAVKEATTESQRDTAIEDFDRFRLDRASRYGRLESWVKTLEQDLQAEADQHPDPIAYLQEMAASTNRETGKKNSDHQYKTKGIHTTENFAYRSDIAKQLLKKEGQKHDKGVYEVLANKDAELIAFEKQAELLGLKESTEPAAEEAPATETVVEETAPVEEVAEEAPTEEVVEPTEEVAPAVEEPVEAVLTKEEVLNNIGNLVKAKKFDEAKKVVEASPLSKEAKKKTLDRISQLEVTKPKEAKAPKKEEVKAVPEAELPPVDYGTEFLETLRAELVNDKAEEAELKESLEKSREAIDGFNEVLDQYEKDLYKISTRKAVLRNKIAKHKEEIKKYKSKIGRANHKKKLAKTYFNEGLKELNTAKKIATASIRLIQGLVSSMKKFNDLINKHEAEIENYNAEMLSLRIREEAIEDATKDTKKKKAETKEQRAEDIEQIQGVQESIKAAEKELKNFVSKDVIAKSKMNQWMQNALVIKNTDNRLASDPEAGIELLAKLEKLRNVLGRAEIEKIISDKFSNLVEKGATTSKTAEQKDAADKDLARLLFDNNDELHPNVVAAISKSLVEYLLKYGTNFMAQDPKQVAQMLGYGDNVEAMPTNAIKLVGNKAFKKNVADTLGKIIQNDVGITIDPEAVIRLNENVDLFREADSLQEKFTASLGQIAAIVGGEIGIFTTVDNIAEENKLTAEQYAEIASGVEASNVEHTGIDMVGLGVLGKELITSKGMYTTFNEIMEEYSGGGYLKEVKTRPVKDKEVKQKVDVEVFEPSDFNKETINNARKQNWRLDFAALDLFKETEKIVKKHLGYVPTVTVDGKETIPTMSYVDEQNQLAKNNSIDLKLRLLGNLEERIKEEGLDTDLFFEYFYGSNGRYYLDNNEANPQNDTFNRFMLGLASNTVDVDLNTDSKSVDTFYVALAQAFGEDVDKMSTANAIEKGKEWLEKGSKTITEELKGDKFEPEAVGHALQGILAVQAFENSKGKPFKTNLVIETDAVTSGIILKTLQLPVMGLQKAKELLKKGGIVFKGDADYDTFVGTNKLIEDGQLDLYRELAQKYSATIDYHLDTEAWAIQAEEGKKLTKRDVEVNERRARLLAASKEGGIMPEFSTDPDKIRGKLRAIFKPVVMVFGYGGGITSIKKKFVSEIIESLPTKLLAEITAAQTALKAGQPKPDMPILNFFKAVAPDQKITVSLLRKGDILDKKINKYQTIRDVMMKDMDALYGSTLESALEEIFGPELVEANRKLNNSFRMMFRIFNHKYEKQLAEFEKANGRKPIAEEKAEIIVELQDSFPAVAPPFAKDTEKGIIVDSKTSGDTRIKAQTMGNFERGDGQKTISVAAVVKEFEEAISAGNVVPIHYIDASIMGTTFNNIPDITQIFDAVVSNVQNGFEANQEYNKQTIEVSKEYSLATKVLESLQQSIDTLSKDEKKAFLADENNGNNEFTIESQLEEDPNLTFEDVLEEMTELDSDANSIRKDLFSSDIKSDHMTGLEATVEVKGKAEAQLEVQEHEALSADLQHYGTSEEPAVETKSKNGILPSNKRTSKATEKAINKECKQ